MTWLGKIIRKKVRKKQKQVAHQFVDDATEKLELAVQEQSYNYIWIGLSALQIVGVVAGIVTSIDAGNAPADLISSDISIVNYGTINIKH